jgi:chemotaxis protein methyltransferase CheR
VNGTGAFEVTALLEERQSSGDHISRRNFERLGRLIYQYCGIKMPASKYTMLEGRLRRRLRATNIVSFDAYCSFLFDEDGLEGELPHLIDAVTTNKTDFFREPKHFEYMAETALPALANRGIRTVRTWSAACSTGAEPYTMAMVLEEFAAVTSGISYSILATDLSTEVLRTAQAGIYPEEMVAPVPPALRKKYVMGSRDASQHQVRIAPKLRSKVGFGRMNLMDVRYPAPHAMHMIFCRNVLIYFDKTTQGAVLKRLCDCLEPSGFLFIGHSESITGLDLPLVQVSNTVFQRL